MGIPIVSQIGMGLSGIGALGSMFGIKKANKRIDNLLAADPLRSTENKGLLQNLYNGRMAGAAAAERNIFGNQASFLGNVGRNASDASQALSLAAGAQGQTDASLENLATQEAQNRLNFVNPILAENDAIYQDQVRRYGDKVAAENIKAQNRQAPWQTLQNLGGSLTGLGASMGSGQGRANRLPQTQSSAFPTEALQTINSGYSSNPASLYSGINTPAIGGNPFNYVNQRAPLNFQYTH